MGLRSGPIGLPALRHLADVPAPAAQAEWGSHVKKREEATMPRIREDEDGDPSNDPDDRDGLPPGLITEGG